MARIRNIKPEFFKHLELQELETENPSQYIMMVYAGLWTQCDKNGVFLYNAKILKNEILPYINFDMQKTLNILEKESYFRKYQSAGREYGFVTNFCKYQFPSVNEKKQPAKYPEPPEKAYTETYPSASQDMPKTVLESHEKECTEIYPNTYQDIPKPVLEPSQEAPSNDTEPEEERNTGDTAVLDDSNEPPAMASDFSEPLLTSCRKKHHRHISDKKNSEVIKGWAKDIEKPPETIRQVVKPKTGRGNIDIKQLEKAKEILRAKDPKGVRVIDVANYVGCSQARAARLLDLLSEYSGNNPDFLIYEDWEEKPVLYYIYRDHQN